VISSLTSVSLIGYGYEKSGVYLEKVYNMKEEPKMVAVQLTPFKFQRDWYSNVVRDCNAAYSMIFTAVSRYSPISSLIHMNKKYVQINMAIPTADGDSYVSEIVQAKRSVVGKAFIAPTYSNDDEEFKDDTRSDTAKKRLEYFESVHIDEPIVPKNYFSVVNEEGEEDGSEDSIEGDDPDQKDIRKLAMMLAQESNSSQVDYDKM